MLKSFAQIEGKCYACEMENKGSNTHNCALSKKPKSEWWINKVQMHLQSLDKKSKESQNDTKSTSTNNENNEGSANIEDDVDTPTAWMGVQLMAPVQFLEKDDHNDM